MAMINGVYSCERRLDFGSASGTEISDDATPHVCNATHKRLSEFVGFKD